MDIDEYITISRTLSDRKINAFKPLYEDRYKSLLKILNMNVQSPIFKLVYSLQRSAEIVTLRGTDYLVYDQYLGQTMNVLNRIYLDSDSSSDAFTYIFKLQAESYALDGELKSALAFASIYRMAKENSDPTYYSEKNREYRCLFTAIQEDFVIAHEIAHLMLHQTNKYGQLLLNSKTSDDNLVQSRKFGEAITTLSKHLGLGEINYDTIDLPTNWGDISQLDTIKDDIVKNLPLPIFGENRSQKSLFTTREEVCCDVIATLLVITMYKGVVNINDIILAIEIALRHLRVIVWIKNKKRFAGDVGERLLSDYLTRTSNIRRFRSHFMKEKKLNIDHELFEHYEHIDMPHEHYDHIIDHPARVYFPMREEAVLSKLKDLESENLSEEMISVKEIGELTGFFSQSHKVLIHL